MKVFSLLCLSALTLLTSCHSGGSLMESSFDPLAIPGRNFTENNDQTSDGYIPGEFVVVTIDNAAFYKQEPKENQDADQLLLRGAELKVISTHSNLVKVELESGEIGYVPQIMVANAASMSDLMPLDGFAPIDGQTDTIPLSEIDNNVPAEDHLSIPENPVVEETVPAPTN